ncbi:MAG: cold shock domain-containing protein [Anaerolineales bacterium]
MERQSGADVFVHYIAILGDGFRNQNEGQQVEFVITLGGKEPQTQEVVAF